MLIGHGNVKIKYEKIFVLSINIYKCAIIQINI